MARHAPPFERRFLAGNRGQREQRTYREGNECPSEDVAQDSANADGALGFN
jgi:hypothetical protein